jgi:hypothetical protein
VVDAALIDGPMAAALAEHRDRCNAVVARASRSYSGFDTAALEPQLRGPVRDLVEACERTAPGSGARVLAAVFEPVVELVGQHRLGGGTHDDLLAALPRLARIVVEEPRRVFGSLANAVVHLAGHGVATDVWLARLEQAAAIGDASVVLRVGQVAAWSLGLSHYRAGALDVAASLPDGAHVAALGDDGGLPAAELVRRLRDDRWFRPSPPANDGGVVHLVGGFRGFGGPFLVPPRVGASGDGIVVRSGDDAWFLHADGWGATLTRTDPDATTALGATAVLADVAAFTVPTSYRVRVAGALP